MQRMIIWRISLNYIDYGIKNEKRLKKQFWKIRKNKRISVTDERSLVIGGKDVQNIIEKEPNDKIKRYTEKYAGYLEIEQKEGYALNGYKK